MHAVNCTCKKKLFDNTAAVATLSIPCEGAVADKEEQATSESSEDDELPEQSSQEIADVVSKAKYAVVGRISDHIQRLQPICFMFIHKIR